MESGLTGHSCIRASLQPSILWQVQLLENAPSKPKLQPSATKSAALSGGLKPLTLIPAEHATTKPAAAGPTTKPAAAGDLASVSVAAVAKKSDFDAMRQKTEAQALLANRNAEAEMETQALRR